MKKEEIILVYDQECPFCYHYSQLIRIKKDFGKLTMINARDDHKVVKDIKKLGFDLNKGMIVKIAEQYYHGADALNILALLSSRSGLFNKLNYWCFKSKTISVWLYPILRSGRNLVLVLLRKNKIT
jgi:predicted DCC family thiol-disulfide oxidoreductase YuxK